MAKTGDNARRFAIEISWENSLYLRHEKEGERDRERQRKRDGEKERERKGGERDVGIQRALFSSCISLVLEDCR